MRLAPIVLTAVEVQVLERVAATGAHAWERKRAQAVLSHSRSLTLNQLSQCLRSRPRHGARVNPV